MRYLCSLTEFAEVKIIKLRERTKIPLLGLGRVGLTHVAGLCAVGRLFLEATWECLSDLSKAMPFVPHGLNCVPQRRTFQS